MKIRRLALLSVSSWYDAWLRTEVLYLSQFSHVSQTNVLSLLHIKINTKFEFEVSGKSLFIGCLFSNTLNKLYIYIYRVIRNDCRGFNNLSYTIHLR